MARRTLKLRRYIYFWLSFFCAYIMPFIVFAVTLGVFHKTNAIVIPTVLVLILGVIKLMTAIPAWVSTWEPSILKGLIKETPKIIILLIALTIAVMLSKDIKINALIALDNLIVLSIVIAFVIVGSVFEAFHMKYKELYLLDSGYVLGTVNK